MSTLLVTHPASFDHLTPPGHPERPDRIRAIEQALEAECFATLHREQAPRGTLEQIALCHDPGYAEALIAAAPESGLVAVDADTVLSPGSIEAALRAVGGAVQAVDEVMTGLVRNAFSALRPPGHHAERSRAMGFCLFNSAAIAARHARKRHGAGRVAIMDWDVHHGNGTQDIFWDAPDVLYLSTHEAPLYPGTGDASERGEHGNIVNVPLLAGTGSAEYRAIFRAEILPALDAFRPELIVISAGFDAHRRDPLANLMLDAADFGWATEALMELADRRCGGRIVSVLEGGYDLQGLASSAAAHVTALMRG